MKIPDFRFWFDHLIRKRVLKQTAPQHGHFLVVNRNPAVVYRNVVLDPGEYEPFRGQRIHFLIRFWWSFENEYLLKELFNTEKRAIDANPGLSFTYCCNSAREVELIKERGRDAILCSHNAFTDPDRFYPENVEKRFDAIYDAQLLEFKRHCLARDVASLALVSFIDRDYTSEIYRNRVRACLPHAYWYNNPMEPGWRSLDHDELRKALNEARVGLCLSAEEGGMKASIQYLLCGLPVVSTENRGGRDEFFHADYARTVPPHPEAVAEAVSAFVEDPPDPDFIRRSALQIMRKHQDNFIEKVNRISIENGGDSYTRQEFEKTYVPGFIKWQTVDAVVSSISS